MADSPSTGCQCLDVAAHTSPRAAPPEAKTRALAGWKGYITNHSAQTPEFVIDADHQLWCIEKSFRMS